MDTLKTTICVLLLWSWVILGKCQMQDDEIDCTFNCTCCKNKECGPGKYFENECKHGCIAGYRGARCYLKCTHDCIKCDLNITTCSECKTGKYGTDCMQNCSVGCLTNKCAVNDGRCKCSDKFYGYSCDKCQIGRYGRLCNNQCSFGCKNYECDRITGDCSAGCIVDTITGDKCDSCFDGFYGHLCHKICSKGCRNATCHKQNGDCLLGCTDGFNGSRCDQCIEGTLVLTCGWETDNQDRINQEREESSMGTQHVTYAVLGTFLAVSAVLIFFVFGCLLKIKLEASRSRRKPEDLKKPIVFAVYENTKENVLPQTERSLYSELEHKQETEHLYSAVVSCDESQ
ncbi:cell death abnormality protein 1-like isoform X2 [Ruditapes philippinarum]|uniref:cell death abnormality protein 1-like isoform X2 n=1 Tax=Ruditapes philippinarum TaxID=129788 RepID=UPI00295B198D|nr:cell death abnormality protein 1-like isoform X2 [Ruditapes philippinarum]